MPDIGVDISLKGKAFKILLVVILAIGSANTFVLVQQAERHHTETLMRGDSLHRATIETVLYFQGQARADLKADHLSLVKEIGETIAQPLDRLEKRVGVVESNLLRNQDEMRMDAKQDAIRTRWNIYQMQQSIDSLPLPVFIQSEKNESTTPSNSIRRVPGYTRE